MSGQPATIQNLPQHRTDTSHSRVPALTTVPIVGISVIHVRRAACLDAYQIAHVQRTKRVKLRTAWLVRRQLLRSHSCFPNASMSLLAMSSRQRFRLDGLTTHRRCISSTRNVHSCAMSRPSVLSIADQSLRGESKEYLPLLSRVSACVEVNDMVTTYETFAGRSAMVRNLLSPCFKCR